MTDGALEFVSSFMAKAAYQGVDAAGRTRHAPAHVPDRELIARQHPLGVLDEGQQEVEFSAERRASVVVGGTQPQRPRTSSAPIADST